MSEFRPSSPGAGLFKGASGPTGCNGFRRTGSIEVISVPPRSPSGEAVHHLTCRYLAAKFYGNIFSKIAELDQIAPAFIDKRGDSLLSELEIERRGKDSVQFNPN